MTSSSITLIGAGPVGLVAALTLQSTGLSVSVIDPTPFSERQFNDKRTYALSYATRGYFEELGIWPQLEAHCHPIKNLHISNQGSFGKMRIYSDKLNLPALGYMVDAGVLSQQLITALQTLNDNSTNPITIIHDNLVSLTANTQGYTLELGSSTLETKLLVGCDGAGSKVRNLINLQATTKDYQQQAIVALLDHEQSHENWAFERFLKDSVTSLLPLTAKRSALIWIANNEMTEILQTLSDAELMTLLQKNFGYKLGHFTHLHNRGAFPLIQTLSETTVANKALLLGNAAQSLHPIAAQGFNLSVRNCFLLKTLLSTSKLKNTTTVLTDFSEKQQQDRKTTLRFIETLNTFVELPLPANCFIKGLALNLLNHCPAAHNHFAKRACRQHIN